MKIIVVEPFREPYVTNIERTLDNMQRLVGGYIQAVYPFEDDEDIALVCNEEGKLYDLTPNRILFRYGKPVDMIVGTFFLCSAPIDSENFEDIPIISLTNTLKNSVLRSC